MELISHSISAINKVMLWSSYYDEDDKCYKYKAETIYVVYDYGQNINHYLASASCLNKKELPKVFKAVEKLVEAKMILDIYESWRPTYMGEMKRPIRFISQGDLKSFAIPDVISENHSHFSWRKPNGKYVTGYSIVIQMRGYNDTVILKGFASHRNKGESIRRARKVAENSFELGDGVMLRNTNSCTEPGRKPNMSDNVDFDMTDKYGYPIYPPIRTKEEEKAMHDEMDRELEAYFGGR